MIGQDGAVLYIDGQVIGSRVKANSGIPSKASQILLLVSPCYNLSTGAYGITLGVSLPGNQDALISAIASTSKNPTLVVLNTNSAVLMPWLIK